LAQSIIKIEAGNYQAIRGRGLAGAKVNVKRMVELGENPATTGWFVRNEWFRTTYYAAAQQSTADGLPAYGCDSTNCLRYNASAPRNIRALLVLAGQSLSNPAGRPNGSLADYLEYNNVDLGTLYEQRPARASKVSVPVLNAPFNDRLVLVDWIAPNPTFPIASLP
jgi:hypothetical protein